MSSYLSSIGSSSLSSVYNTGSSGTSGLDVTATVDQILQAESAPEQVWQNQQTALNAQITDLTNLGSKLGSLQSALDALRDPQGVLAASSATSSQPSILTASADAGAAAGTHLVKVTRLASTASWYSDPVNTPNHAFSSGSFNVKVGSGPDTPVTVDASHSTLDSLATYLNSLNLGLNASVVTDSSGARLALVSATSGLAGDIQISSNTTGLALNQGATGEDASVTVDGVPLTSSNNQVKGALPGVTLNLASAAPGTAVALTIGPNTQGVQQALQDFVDSYNIIANGINQEYTYNAVTQKSGALSGDSVLRDLQQTLLGDLSNTDTTSGINSLSSLGIHMNNDGTLTLKSDQLTAALSSNAAGVASFLTSTSSGGFSQTLKTDLQRFADTTSGPIGLDLKGAQSSLASVTKQISDFDTRLETRRKQLLDEYTRVDVMLRQFPLLLAQVSEQLASLNGTSSR